MTTSRLHNPDAMGIRQYAVIALGQRRVDILPKILNHLFFGQSLIFVGETDRTNHIKKALSPFKPLSLCGEISDDERKKVIDVWKKFGSRVMILTDTTSDGLDDQYVNLVLNLNLPDDCTNFMQRVARAHFTGESGAAITILTTQQDVTTFLAMVKNNSLTVKVLDIKTEYPHDITFNQSFYVQAMDFVEFCENAQTDEGAVATRAHKEQEPSKQAEVKDSGAAAFKIEEPGKKVIVDHVASSSEIKEPSKPFNFKKKDRGGFASNFCGSGFGGGNGSGLSNRDIFGEHGCGTNAGFGSYSGGFGNDQENGGGFGGQIGPRKFFRSTDEGDVQMYPGQCGGFGERGGNVGRVDGNRRDGFGGQANIFQNGNANGAAAGFNQHNQVVNGYQQSDAPPRRRFIR